MQLSCHSSSTAAIARLAVRRAALLGLMVTGIATVGCGDGTVAASGTIRVEGETPPAGRLSLNPLGGGQRAFAVVSEDGSFSLRTADSDGGAVPGEYVVVFQHPLDEKTKQKAAELTGPGYETGSLTVIYEGPKSDPFVIPTEGSQELNIDIQQDLGWQRSLSE